MSVAAPPQIYKGHDEGSYFLNVPAFPGRKCPVWISFEDWESRDCECKNIKIIITQYLSSIYSMHGKFSETQRANNSNNCDLFFRARSSCCQHLLLQHYQLRQLHQQQEQQQLQQSHLQHSSQFQGLCLMKSSSETLQKGNRTFARPNLRED